MLHCETVSSNTDLCLWQPLITESLQSPTEQCKLEVISEGQDHSEKAAQGSESLNSVPAGDMEGISSTPLDVSWGHSSPLCF